MAYATVEKGGKIQVYGVLPSSYHSEIANVLGGFDKLSDEELEKHGFYPVEFPTLTDPLFERRGSIYFDRSNKVFKYNIETIELDTIEDLKRSAAYKIEEEKNNILQRDLHKIIEALELGEPIPTELSASRANIRTQATKLKEEINSLTTQKEVLTYTGSIIIK